MFPTALWCSGAGTQLGGACGVRVHGPLNTYPPHVSLATARPPCPREPAAWARAQGVRIAGLPRFTAVCAPRPRAHLSVSPGDQHTKATRHRPPPRAPPGSWRLRGWSGRGRRDLSPRPREVKPRAPRPAVGGRAGAGPEAAVMERRPLPAVRRPREHRRGSRCGGQHGGWCICVRGPGGQPASPPAEPSGTACHRPPCATQPGSPGSPRRPPTPESVSLECFLCLRQPRSTVRAWQTGSLVRFLNGSLSGNALGETMVPPAGGARPPPGRAPCKARMPHRGPGRAPLGPSAPPHPPPTCPPDSSHRPGSDRSSRTPCQGAKLSSSRWSPSNLHD